MTHNWRWHYDAEEITQRLHEMGLIKESDLLKVHEVIQCMLEETR